jgi:hypothetical protein
MIQGNSAGPSADGSGGGTYWGTLYNCTLTGHRAKLGGGAFGSTLCNCTLAGNSAFQNKYGNGGYGGGA